MNTNHTSDSVTIDGVATKHNYQNFQEPLNTNKMSCTKSCLFPVSLMPFQPFVQTFCLYTPSEVKHPLNHRWFLQSVVGEKKKKKKIKKTQQKCWLHLIGWCSRKQLSLCSAQLSRTWKGHKRTLWICVTVQCSARTKPERICTEITKHGEYESGQHLPCCHFPHSYAVFFT